MGNLLIAFTVIVMAASGCRGVKFVKAPTNAPLPSTFSVRAIYPAGVAGYNFKDLVGAILLTDSDKDPVWMGVVRPTGYTPEVETIDEADNYYNSKIERGAEVQGSYLAFAANMKAEDLAEITIFDIAHAGINFSEGSNYTDIEGKLRTWVGQHPKQSQDAGKRRLWIKAAVKSKKIYKSYIKIDANASGQIEVIGGKAGVYAKQGSESREVIIAFEAIDIDRLVGATAAAPTIVDKSQVLNMFGYKLPIKKPIKKPINLPN